MHPIEPIKQKPCSLKLAAISATLGFLKGAKYIPAMFANGKERMKWNAQSSMKSVGKNACT